MNELKAIMSKPLAIYTGLAILICITFFSKGLILTLDLNYVPHPPFPDQLTASYPFHALVAILSRIISAEIVEKMLLVGSLSLAGWAAHRLARYVLPQGLSRAAYHIAPYFCGTLYMINPFVYDRFMAGQLGVLLGYMLLPFFITSVMEYFKAPEKRRMAICAAWLFAIIIASIHTVPLALVVASLLLALAWYQHRGEKKWRLSVCKQLGLGALALLMLNTYWLIPFLLGKGQMATAIGSFDQSDPAAFATNDRGLGVLGNILSLRGFWGEAKNLFLVPEDIFSWWLLPVIALWAVLLLGAIYAWRRQKGLAAIFTLVVIVGTILATGTTGTIFGGINQWLYNNIPLFSGYRESQKFTVLLALAYVYFSAWGVFAIIRLFNENAALKKWAGATILLLLIPLGLAPLMPFGFHGQLHPKQYPIEWQAINERLAAEAKGKKVLFLPWHQYMRFEFAGRVIANPAEKFFSSDIVMSNNPELKGAKSYGTTRAQSQLENNILPRAHADDNYKDMASDLQNLEIHYILLAKEQDYKKYDFIASQPNITLIQETPGLKLYKVESKYDKEIR